MQIATFNEKLSDHLNKVRDVSYFKNRYGVQLDSEKVIEQKIIDLQTSVYRYHKVIDNVVLIETKFVKPGRFLDRKRQVSKIIGSQISAKSWNDLILKIRNLYVDFYEITRTPCKKELYNSFKIKSYQKSSKLENVFYSDEKPKSLDELYSIYLMD